MKFQDIKLYQIIFFLLSIACMVMIFRFSCENSEKSTDTSGNVTDYVVEYTVSDYEELSPAEQSSIYAKIDHIVRKTAHFTIFTALGFLTSCAAGKRKLLSKSSAFVLAICFLYACSDEIHQFFVPGRACRPLDVLIDTSGSLTGILISVLCMTICSAIIRKIYKKNEAGSP
ncbi:MAG: VanZ family protein [Ruminococcus sp.]|nr:VanZ family protein [Ruminococcus sp.]